MLKLYVARNSICTQKVLITLAEKQLAYETHTIDLFNNEQFSPAYLAINPKGVVPSLQHDGRNVIESTLICEYVDDCFPDPCRLIPADPHHRAQMRLWSKAVDEGLFEATRELSFSAMFRERMRAMTPEQREGRFRNVGDPVKRARFMSTYEHGIESPYVFNGIAAWEIAFRNMEKALGTSGSPWIVGTGMTLADINMIPFVARLHYLGLLDIWTADRPLTHTWWTNMRKHPTVESAIAKPLTPQEIEAMASFGGKIAPRVAERRREYLATA